MTDNRLRVEIESAGDGILEVSCFGSPCASGFLRWRMPTREAQDLAQWWRSQGSAFDSVHPPIRNLRFGSVLVSMFTPTLIHVHVFNEHGTRNNVGYCFPSAVVEHLADTYPFEHEDGRPGTGGR